MNEMNKMNEMNEMNLEEAHEKYFGIANEYEKNIPDDLSQREIEKTNAIFLDNISVQGNQLHSQIISFTLFETIPSSQANFVKNVRINTKYQHLVNFIILEVGGQRMDKIYYDIYDVLIKYYDIPNDGLIPMDILMRGLPRLLWHSIVIRIEFKEEVDANNDIVTPRRYSNIMNNVNFIA